MTTAKIYSEGSLIPLFTLSDSVKYKKVNAFRIHCHPEIELGYITGGSGDYVLESEKYEAVAGRMFLVRPNEQHCVPTIRTPSLSSFNFHITPYYIWNVLADYIDPSRLSVFVGGELDARTFDDLGGVVERIRYLCGGEADKSRAEIRYLTLGLMVAAAERARVKVSGGTESVNDVLTHRRDIQSALTYIDGNFTESVTLDDIAASADLSRSHMSALFKKTVGMPPYEYLLLKRIEHAVSLLRLSDDSVMNIAVRCGFANLANFNRAFRRVTGMSPSEYRRSLFN